MFTLKINTGNAIFHDSVSINDSFCARQEIRRLLYKVADDLEFGGKNEGIIIELNGNKCGEWKLTGFKA